MKGHVNLVLVRNGEAIDQRSTSNLVVANGAVHIAKLLGSPGSVTPMGYIGIGIGFTAPAITDFELVAERFRDSADTLQGGTGIQYTAAIENDGDHGESIREAGIFDSAAIDTGIMMARATFSSIALAVGDVLLVEWNITI